MQFISGGEKASVLRAVRRWRQGKQNFEIFKLLVDLITWKIFWWPAQPGTEGEVGS
jgi:hypothetical protein